MRLLVSACLLGVCCRYDGASKPCEAICALASEHELIPVCPEQLGGLPTPREPAERQPDGRVMTRDGRDVTEAYRKGAEEVLMLARLMRCEGAILKEKSPSCGSGLIYDGTFSGMLTKGKGVCTERLEENGLTVIGESETERIASLIF